MMRKPRVHEDGAFYHIASRGNRKGLIFLETEDYAHYLKLVDRYKERYGLGVHAYALMPNHVHLLVQAGETPLAKPMQGIQQCYTQKWNRKYGQVGHVFQGRYYAALLEDEEHLLATVRYIHLNPVEAGLVEVPEAYQWSSYGDYVRGRSDGPVDTTFISALLAQYDGGGSAGLVAAPQKAQQPAVTQARVGRKPTCLNRPSLDDLLVGFCRQLRITPQSVYNSRDSASVAARKMFVYAAVRLAGYRATEAARFLDRAPCKVSVVLRELDEGDAALRCEVNAVFSQLLAERKVS